MDFLLLKFLKFACVGFSGLVIDFSATYICKEKIKIHKFISNAIGFVIAATSNYILNRIWTFESSNSKIGLEFVEFFGVSVVGLGINTMVLWVLNEKFHWNFYFSKLLLYFCTNTCYIISRCVFQERYYCSYTSLPL